MTPQPLLGDPSYNRKPLADGTALVSAQKYTAGASPSYTNPRTSKTRSLNRKTSPAALCIRVVMLPNGISVLCAMTALPALQRYSAVIQDTTFHECRWLNIIVTRYK